MFATDDHDVHDLVHRELPACPAFPIVEHGAHAGMPSMDYATVSFVHAVNEGRIPYKWRNEIELARNYLVALECR